MASKLHEKNLPCFFNMEDIEFLEEMVSKYSLCTENKCNWHSYYQSNHCKEDSLTKTSYPCHGIFSPLTQLTYDPQNLFNDMINNGLDQEDIDFLKMSFNSLLLDAKENYWTANVIWDDHSDRFLEDNSSEDYNVTGFFPLNKTGCARSEGYTKIDKSLLPEIHAKRNSKKTKTLLTVKKDIAPHRNIYKGNKQSLLRDARNYQRRMSTAFQTITHSNLLKLNELKFRQKKIRLGKSEIHGLGMFAAENIAPDEIIIECVGQIVRPIIADMRDKSYKSSGIKSSFFRLDDGMIIDANKYGNLSKYINHSCSPNSYLRILNINNKKKYVIYSRKPIEVDEEITYDYKMS